MQYIDIDSAYRNRTQFPLQARFDVLREQNHSCGCSSCLDTIRDPVSDQMVLFPNPLTTGPLAFYEETLQNPFDTIVERNYLPYMYSTETDTVIQLDELPIASENPFTTSIIENSLYPRNSIPLPLVDEFYRGRFLEDVTNNEFRKITSFNYDDTTNAIFQTALVQSYITTIDNRVFITTTPSSSTQIPTSNIDRFYQGKFIQMLTGNAAGSIRLIINYTTTTSTQFTFQLSAPFEGNVASGDRFAVVSDRRWFATIESPFTNAPSRYPAFREPINTFDIWNATLLATSDKHIEFIQLALLPMVPSVAVAYSVKSDTTSPANDDLGSIHYAITNDANGSFGITNYFKQANTIIKYGFGLRTHENLPQLLYAQPNTMQPIWETIVWSPFLSQMVAFGANVNSVTLYRFMRSQNGVNWGAVENAAIGDAIDRSPIEYSVWHPATNIFVAGNDNSKYYSNDGENWTRILSDNFACIATDNVQMVVMGTSTTYETSVDGITWVTGTAPLNNFKSITYNNIDGWFIAVRDGLSQLTGVVVGTSITWTIRTGAADRDWLSVTFADALPLAVAVCAEGTDRVMTSSDGVLWTLQNTPDNNWQSVVWSDPLTLFVAVGNSGIGTRVMTSPDGVTWTLRQSAADQDWRQVIWTDALALFVALSANGDERVMTSPDGITWTLQNTLTSNDWYVYLSASSVNSGAQGWSDLAPSPQYYSPFNATTTQQISFASGFSNDRIISAISYFDGTRNGILAQLDTRVAPGGGPWTRILNFNDNIGRVIRVLTLSENAGTPPEQAIGILVAREAPGNVLLFFFYVFDISTGNFVLLSQFVIVIPAPPNAIGWKGDVTLIEDRNGDFVPACICPAYGTDSNLVYNLFNEDGDASQIVVYIESFQNIVTARLAQTTINDQLRIVVVGIDEQSGLFVTLSSSIDGFVGGFSSAIVLDNSETITDVQIINSNDDQPLIVYSKILSNGMSQLISLRLTEFVIQAGTQYRIRENPPLLAKGNTGNDLTSVTSTTAILPTSIAPLTDDIYKCDFLHLYTENTYYIASEPIPFNEFRRVHSYDGLTGELTFSPPLTSIPDLPLSIGDNQLELFTLSLIDLGADSSGNGYNFNVANGTYEAQFTDDNGLTIENIMLLDTVFGFGLVKDVSGDLLLQNIFTDISSGGLHFSISLWFLLEVGTLAWLIRPFNNDFVISLDGAGLVLIFTTSTIPIEVTINIPFGLWYNLVVQVSEDGFSVYLNGEYILDKPQAFFLNGSVNSIVDIAYNITDIRIGELIGATDLYMTNIIISSEIWSPYVINNQYLFGIGVTNNVQWEILGNVTDQFNPLYYNGTPTQSQPICYEMELTHLTLPNVLLRTGFGDRIAFYPYVYVEFQNINHPEVYTFYSNNPNARRVVFKVPIRDTSTPDRAKFVNNYSGMKILTKFNPNDNFKFAVYLPNGELFETFEEDNMSPLPPQFLLQLSATVGFRRVDMQ